MLLQGLHGPHCPGPHGMRHGPTRHGTPRSRGPETWGQGGPCLVDAAYAGHSAAVQHQSVALALHARGRRETARGLPVSPTTVIKALKKRAGAAPGAACRGGRLEARAGGGRTLAGGGGGGASWPQCRTGGTGVLRRAAIAAALAVARAGAPHGARMSAGGRAAQGRRLFALAKTPGALWEHEVVPGWRGRLRAAHGWRAAARGHGEAAQKREQTEQSRELDEAVNAPHEWFFHDGTEARSGDGAVSPSL
jgi:hypothetical protein